MANSKATDCVKSLKNPLISSNALWTVENCASVIRYINALPTSAVEVTLDGCDLAGQNLIQLTVHGALRAAMDQIKEESKNGCD